MPFDRRDLDAAVARGLLTREQAEALARMPADARPDPHPDRGSDLAAAFAATAASALFGVALVAADAALGGAGLAAVAGGGAVGAALAARFLWRRHRYASGGALSMVAALLVPAATLGLLRAAGLWSVGTLPWHAVAPWAGGAFWVSLSALAATAVAFSVFHFPPLAAMIAAAAWFTAQAAAPLLFGPHPSWAQRALVSVTVGLLALGTGVAVDGHTRHGIPSWIYVAALVAFRGGAAGLGGEGTGALLALLLVDAALLASALLLRRPVFALAASLGAASSFGGLAEASGVDGLVVGALLGLGITAASEFYRRHRAELEDRLARRLPSPLRRLLPGGGAP